MYIVCTYVVCMYVRVMYTYVYTYVYMSVYLCVCVLFSGSVGVGLMERPTDQDVR